LPCSIRWLTDRPQFVELQRFDVALGRRSHGFSLTDYQ
jgi:hypothetical protein